MTVAPLSYHHSPYRNLPFGHYNDPPKLPQTFSINEPSKYRSRKRPLHSLTPHIDGRKFAEIMLAHNKEEMESLQQASDQYHPDIEGPLVGEKKPMTALMHEYAQADPTYVAKTASLAATHSAYRSIKGDGQCGWRGAIFGYFETLLNLGDIQTVLQEETRMQSFKETMIMAGTDYDLLCDMFDYTWELFANLKHTVENQSKDESVLMEMFNKEMESNFIICHFKLIVSAFMELRADQYQPFLDMPLSDYRASRIDPSNQEIDQIGLQALVDSIIAPAGIGLEVSYLDRSQGDSVTPHQFVHNGNQLPNIELLYRPGHYDMIYKDTSAIRVSLANVQIQVHDDTYMTPRYAAHGPAAHVLPSAFTPSESSPHTDYSPDGQHNYQLQGGHFADYMYYYPMNGHNFAPVAEQEEEPEIEMDHPPAVTISPCMVTTSPSPTNPLAAPSTPDLFQQSTSTLDDRFRMTSVFYDYERRRQESIPLETGPLRENLEDHAHYLSLDFRPHIWSPDEYERP